MRRREFLAGAAGLALGSAFWEQALRARARAAASSYGALGAADANGLRLPPGFTSRLIARSNQPVPGTAYPWHIFPDGQATFPTSDGGWVLVSNSESVAASGAGSSAIRFRENGSDRRRLPHPRRHERQLRRRRDAVGPLAVLRGARLRPRLGVRPAALRARASSARRSARSTTRPSRSTPPPARCT